MVAPPGLEPRSKGDSIVEHWKLNELQNPLCWTATPRGYVHITLKRETVAAVFHLFG